MGKSDEIGYPERLGAEGRRHALDKPFSDPGCGQYLIDLGFVLSLLPPPPGRLLDLGIGTGWTSAFFALRGYLVVGQDISGDMIRLAEQNRERYGVSNVDLRIGDYEDLPFQAEFDMAVFFDSLHHSEDEQQALVAVYRALKPGGICVALEPGAGHSRSAAARKARRSWGVTERDMPPRRILRAGRKAGFRTCRVYLRCRGPFEILPHLSLGGWTRVGKSFLRFLPVLGMLGSNVVVLRK